MKAKKRFAKNSKLPIIIVLFLIAGILIPNAYAYLDPGSGSIIFQAIIGALVGVGIAIKIYWEKLKFKLSNLLRK